MAARSTGLVFKSSLVGCCIAALLAGAPQAFAQEAAPAAESSDAIVVTAQRRAERAVDVPITITTVTSQQLESAGATQLSDIAQISPNLRFDSAANFVQPTIRGVGTAVANSGVGGNVGIYVDGFYSPNPVEADFQLMNVESVQVLKGPQGTLFGRNTTGGAILVTSGDPGHETSAEVQATFARFGAQRYQGYATTGLTDNIAVDIEGLYSSGDGFVRNITTGADDDGAYENWSVRTGMLIDLSDDVSVLLRYAHTDTNDPTMLNTNLYSGPEGLGTGFGSAYATDPDEVATSGPTAFFGETDTFQATVRADLGFANLTSYTQYRTEEALMVEDLDHTAGVRPFVLHIGVENETISQEFLLTSHEGGPLRWTVGLFYFSNEDNWTTGIGSAAPDNYSSIALGGSGTRTVSYAAFADVTYALTPQLFLTGGLRYSRDEIQDPYFIAPFAGVQTPTPELTGDTLTPRIVLRYAATPESSIYASYTEGYKAGIVDVGGGTGNRVEPEDITSYEIGYKYDSGALAFDMSAFYYDYANLQVSLYRDDGFGNPSAAILNAASSEIYGLETQIRYDLSANFTVNAGVSWTHARYQRFENAPVYTPCATPGVPAPGTCPTGGESFYIPPGITLTDVHMQRTPEWTANIGGLYTTGLGGGELALSGNLYYTSEFYHGPSGTQFLEDAYHTLALRAEWTDPSEHWSVAVFGDNVTDERYRTQVQYNQYGIGSVWSAPATYGITIGYRY